MLVPVPVSVVPVPKGYWCSTAWGTDTGLFGTSTNSVLHVGTGTILCGTGTTASANAPLTVALPGTSR